MINVRIIDGILYDAGLLSLIFTGNLNQHVMLAILKKRNMKFQTADLPRKVFAGKCEVFTSLLIDFRVFLDVKLCILLYSYQRFG